MIGKDDVNDSMASEDERLLRLVPKDEVEEGPYPMGLLDLAELCEFLHIDDSETNSLIQQGLLVLPVIATNGQAFWPKDLLQGMILGLWDSFMELWRKEYGRRDEGDGGRAEV